MGLVPSLALSGRLRRKRVCKGNRPEKPILERKKRLVSPLTMPTAQTIHYHLASTSPPNDGLLLFLRGNLSYDAHSAISETNSPAVFILGVAALPPRYSFSVKEMRQVLDRHGNHPQP